MESSSGSSDGPAVLQLQKWGQVLDLSEFGEAYISPTRELLLLVSYEYEALLLPLIAGKKSCKLMNKDYLDRSNSKNSQGYSSGPFSSAEETACTLNSFDDAPCTSESAEAASNSEFQHHRSSLAYYPVVPDVRSVAWGHCGDGYNQFEDSDFREFLIVSGNSDIIVHAFRFHDKNANNRSIASENGHVNGEWVKWEPSHSTQLKEELLHPDNSEFGFSLNNGRAIGETVHDKTNSNDSFSNMQKSWFKTFLTQLDTHVNDGAYVSMFPRKSTVPHSAEVVSFSIYRSTLLFLEFLSCTNIPNQDHNVETSEELRAETINSLSRTSDRSYPYKCSQVFSSSSHHLIGLVLISSDESSAGNDENHLDNPNNLLVVILMLHQWGIQWLCSVDLHDSCLAVGPSQPWADFQFLENFLVCLNTCGLICIWEAKSGKLIARFDALDNLGPSTKLPSSDGKTNKPNRLHINRIATRELISHRFFRRLMVLPSSLLLGVVDDYGVVYIFLAGDYIPKNYILTEKYKHVSKHCDLSILSHWNTAGCDIGSQHPLVDPSGHQALQNSNMSFEGFSSNDAAFRKRTEQLFQDKDGLSDTYVSGFSSASCTSGQKIFSSKFSNKMRKVFLPLEKSNNRDCICLSPFGIIRLIKSYDKKSQNAYKIICTEMHVGTIVDERNLCANQQSSMKEHALLEESLGFSFQGYLYLVTAHGLSVILPSISVTTTDLPVKPLRYMLPDAFAPGECQNLLLSKKIRQQWRPWQVEALDRILLYDGFKEAKHVCLDNGWDLRFACFRQMHLSLQYFMSDEIEKSLDMLADVNLAEEGVLQLLFISAHQMCQGAGKGSEVALACRLLALASRFATKMIRKYGALNRKDNFIVNNGKTSSTFYSKPSLHMQNGAKLSYSEKLFEMAYYLEVIRDLLSRLASKNRKPVQALTDGRDATTLVEKDTVQSETSLPIVADTSLDQVNSIGTLTKNESAFEIHELEFDDASALAMEKVNSSEDPVKFRGLFIHEAGASQSSMIPLENPKDMILRWQIDKFDPKGIVKDALHVGRLPLAVLQLHLHRERKLVDGDESHDAFSEVQDIGKAIAYDLFLKGECGLAVATLQRLGEDIELLLRQLLHGTLRRSLRRQLTEEMRQLVYLKSSELEVLEKIFLIERLYPSSSFWKSYFGIQKLIHEEASTMTLPKSDSLTLALHVRSNLTIDCGDVDGVVTGSWASTSTEQLLSAADEDDNRHCGYWASAVVWSDAWEQRTWDRMVLDQPSHMGVYVSWESQLEYYISHNDLEEIFKLLDVIPVSLMSAGSLKINFDNSYSTGSGSESGKTPDHGMYICATEEMEPAFLYIPQVKIFRSSSMSMCSSWLKVLIEEELAKKYVFTKESWHGSAEIMQLITRAGLFTIASKMSFGDESSSDYVDSDILNDDNQYHKDTAEVLHKLVVYHCAEYGLPYLLDLYLDHHNLPVDYGSLSSLLLAAGDYHWVKWLLTSRTKGSEYEASFYNLRSNLSQQDIYTNNLGVLEFDEIIHTVDDVAEGRSELAALATLMYATSPLQKCICTGIVNKHSSSSSFSFQCTLENLRPTIHHFPTIWRTLVASCSGQDANDFPFSCSQNNGKSAFDNYLNWRNSIFLSAGGDTSLEQMLPCTFPKSIRRLIKIFVQGPVGWQSLPSAISAEESYNSTNINMNWNNGSSAISWETSIERSIEKELYSSFEDKGSGVEQNLHRGRALAAFNQILGARALSLKSSNAHQQIPGQSNIQSDVQAMLAPLSQSERSTISSVAPLAIMHFEDPVMVASCMMLLELCGLSSSMLRVDISALKRISSYYRSIGIVEHYDQVSPKGSASAIHTSSYEIYSIISLAQVLADDYVHNYHLSTPKNRDDPSKSVKGEPQEPNLTTVLHHLEKACLPSLVERNACGSWLQTGIGNGSEFRSKQKNASQQWSLVTKFCQMHHLPLSTQYLSLLAQENDWVGFLTEAQVGGFPIDVIVQVAAEFSDPRLRTHVVNVLKTSQSARRKANSLITAPNVDNSTIVPPELFEIIAQCERQEKPGEALLMKAKDLHWCLLAMVASCFSDVSPLSCLTVWLEITAARETSTIMADDFSSKIAKAVGAAVEVTNSLPSGCRKLNFQYNRRNPKRRCLIGPTSSEGAAFNTLNTISSSVGHSSQWTSNEDEMGTMSIEQLEDSNDSDYGLASLSNMVAVLCEKHLFLPLLRAFEMFMPSCSLLPFIRSLQAFSQMRLSEASAHLTMFSARIKEESYLAHKDGLVKTEWVSSTAVKAANTMISRCPSAYEKRCLLQLLAATDFADGGSASACFRRLYWKINLAEPSLRKDDDVYLGNETLDDESLLTALIKNGRWEQARNWARQLESSGPSWKSAPHRVTEAQAEAMVAEWKDFLWDVPEERAALWNHCQTLFVRYSFPPLQAGLFFLKHAEAIEKDIPAGELHDILLLSLQWLSGTITQSPHVYPLHLLREIETRVWLLAVESEAQSKAEGDTTSLSSIQNLVNGNSASVIDQTATIVSKMDDHINAMRTKSVDRNNMRDHNQSHNRQSVTTESTSLAPTGSSARMKRRVKSSWPSRRPVMDNTEMTNEPDDSPNYPQHFKSNGEVSSSMPLQEGMKIETSLSGWEERVRPAEMEKAVLSLLEFGQIAAAKQLQQKISPENVPEELLIIDSALKIAVLSNNNRELSESVLDQEVLSVVQSADVPIRGHMIEPLQALESLAAKCNEGCGRGLCWRIIAVVKAAKVLGLPFAEAFEKKSIELLQLLSLKAQDSFDEAKLLVQTHTMPPPNIAQVLAESFLKGLLAAHRGGYMDSQKEEGPAPLLWRFADFLKWAELCPSEPEIGHALMRLVMTGHEIPHACEVELLILSHHFYKSSACLDGVDVLVTLAANRVESYVLEGDFSCLARLVTGVSNFYALNFILNILIENGQLELLLQRYSTTDLSTGTAAEVRGFRMAVLTSLKLFNPHDIDAFAMVYNHFDMKHETASLLESRSLHYMQQWLSRREKDRLTEDLLEAMRLFIEAAEVLCTIDAGRKTHHACAQASLLSLQIRIPDIQWIDLPEGKARNVLVEQSRFQEALILAEAYDLNQPSEWTPVLWNQTLKPDLIEQFIAEFVAVLPLHPTTLMELARFYRAEVAARGDQSHFSVWLTPGGLPAEWIKHLGRSFRSMLKRTRDLRLRTQLATVATGFPDIINACNKVMDKVPETAGPLLLRRGHGGAYLPLM